MSSPPPTLKFLLLPSSLSYSLCHFFPSGHSFLSFLFYVFHLYLFFLPSILSPILPYCPLLKLPSFIFCFFPSFSVLYCFFLPCFLLSSCPTSSMFLASLCPTWFSCLFLPSLCFSLELQNFGAAATARKTHLTLFPTGETGSVQEKNQWVVALLMYIWWCPCFNWRHQTDPPVGRKHQILQGQAEGYGLHHLWRWWLPCGSSAALHARQSGVSTPKLSPIHVA